MDEEFELVDDEFEVVPEAPTQPPTRQQQFVANRNELLGRLTPTDRGFYDAYRQNPSGFRGTAIPPTVQAVLDADKSPLVSGEDRGLYMLSDVGQGLTLGGFDELGGLAGGAESAVKSIASGELPKWQNMLNAYRKTRDTLRDLRDESRMVYPESSGVREFIGGLATAPIAPAASPVKAGAALGAVAGLGGSDADVTKGEVLPAAAHTVGGALLGGAIGAVPGAMSKAATFLSDPVNQSKLALGKTLGMADKPLDAIYDWLGNKSIAKNTTIPKPIPTKKATPSTKELIQRRGELEFGASAPVIAKATKQLGPVADVNMGTLDPGQLDRVAEAMSMALQGRGVENATPEFVRQNLKQLAAATGRTLDEMTPAEFIRMANKRDAGWWVSVGEGIKNFWVGGKLTPENALHPALREMFDRVPEMRDAYLRGDVNRLGMLVGEEATKGGPGANVYQYRVRDLLGLTDEAMSGAQAVDPADVIIQKRTKLGPDLEPFGNWSLTRDQINSPAEQPFLDALRTNNLERARSAEHLVQNKEGSFNPRIKHAIRDPETLEPRLDEAGQELTEWVTNRGETVHPQFAGNRPSHVREALAEKFDAGREISNPNTIGRVKPKLWDKLDEQQRILDTYRKNVKNAAAIEEAERRLATDDAARAAAEKQASDAAAQELEGVEAQLSTRTIGRQFFRDKIDPLLGRSVGAGLGYSALDTLGGALGFAAPPKSLSGMLESASGIGQHLRADALTKMSTEPGVAGNFARWATSDPSKFATRQFVLAHTPEFRAEVAGDETVAP